MFPECVMRAAETPKKRISTYKWWYTAKLEVFFPPLISLEAAVVVDVTRRKMSEKEEDAAEKGTKGTIAAPTIAPYLLACALFVILFPCACVQHEKGQVG